MPKICISEMVVGNYICEWQTGGKRLSSENVLTSQRFYAGIEKQTEWDMKLYLSGTLGVSLDYGLLQLRLLRGWPVTVTGKIEVNLLKEPERVVRDPLRFHHSFREKQALSFPDFLLVSEVKKQAQRGIKKIKITCRLSIDENPEKKILPHSLIAEDLKIRSVDFLDMLWNQMNCDVKVCAQGGVVFPAHKFMLSARSSKFKAMLRYDPPEIFTSLSPDVAVELLNYIYSGTFSPKKRLTIENLASVANVYGVNGLLEACNSYLDGSPLGHTHEGLKLLTE